jgi:hypothetical protein
LLAFVPSLLYFVMAPVSVSLGLWLAFSAAFAIGVHAFTATRKLRLFDAAGVALYGPLALFEGFVQPGSTVADTSLVIECGLLATALWSMSAGQPFTAAYRIARSLRDSGQSARVHALLTALWTTCFAAMAALDAGTVVLHRLSPLWANSLTLLAYAATLTFTWQLGAYIDRHEGNLPIVGKR